VTALCTPESETERPEQIAAPSQNELERMAVAAPPMFGAEYLTTAASRGYSPDEREQDVVCRQPTPSKRLHGEKVDARQTPPDVTE